MKSNNNKSKHVATTNQYIYPSLFASSLDSLTPTSNNYFISWQALSYGAHTTYGLTG
jgi:hypothetical protein